MPQFMVLPEILRRSNCERKRTAFRNYISQDAAVEKLLDLVYEGYSNPEHCVPENVMLVGPPSAGKTTLVKMFAKELGLLCVTTDATQLNKGVEFAGKKVKGGPDTLIHLIRLAFAQNGEELSGVQAGGFDVFELPPIIVFVDEIHGLTKVVCDALLKATERADGMLFGSKAVLDCKKVTFIGATTSWGKLPPAFQSRFRGGRVELFPMTPEEVSRVVDLNTKWGMDLSRRVVFYGGLVPRETLAFARAVERYSERNGVSLTESVEPTARREGIDEHGMKRQRVDILKALNNAGDNGLILRSLALAVHMEADEVVKDWLPPLMFGNSPAVIHDGSAYQITSYGRDELKKRGLV